MVTDKGEEDAKHVGKPWAGIRNPVGIDLYFDSVLKVLNRYFEASFSNGASALGAGLVIRENRRILATMATFVCVVVDLLAIPTV